MQCVFIPVYCVYLVLDCTQVSISGVLRGMGKQAIGALIYIVSLCRIGILSSYILTSKLSSSGSATWISLAIGSGIALIAVLLVILHTDWGRETQRAMERLGLLYKTSMEMRQLGGGEEEERIEFTTPFTNELFESEKVLLFSRSSESGGLDTEAGGAMLLSVLFFFMFH